MAASAKAMLPSNSSWVTDSLLDSRQRRFRLVGGHPAVDPDRRFRADHCADGAAGAFVLEVHQLGRPVAFGGETVGGQVDQVFGADAQAQRAALAERLINDDATLCHASFLAYRLPRPYVQCPVRSSGILPGGVIQTSCIGNVRSRPCHRGCRRHGIVESTLRRTGAGCAEQGEQPCGRVHCLSRPISIRLRWGDCGRCPTKTERSWPTGGRKSMPSGRLRRTNSASAWCWWTCRTPSACRTSSSSLAAAQEPARWMTIAACASSSTRTWGGSARSLLPSTPTRRCRSSTASSCWTS